MTKRVLFLMLSAAIVSGIAAPAAAQAKRCERTSVRYGEDAADIARRCGVNVEALKAMNPGLDGRRPQAGTFVVVPSPALPSVTVPQFGNPALQPVDPTTGARYRR